MNITIQNENLRAVFAVKGAELQSLFNTNTNIEYMWNGDPAFWPKHSPVLFPTVGPLKDDTYYYNEKKYSLLRHGFAKEKEFEVEKVSESEVVFTLSQSPESLEIYPFDFVLKLRYTLDGAKLTCGYEVYNPGTQELLFSVGAHPAFAVPMVKDTVYSDYFLEFNKKEELHRLELKNGGFIAGGRDVFPTENNRIPLQHSLFYGEAIVFEHLQSNCITVGSDLHKHGIHFHFEGFPCFVVWAFKDAPFVCLEPWCGFSDTMNHNQQLKDKKGIIPLAPGAAFHRNWSVECF